MSTIHEDTDDIFEGGSGLGVPSIKLQQPGDTATGLIYRLQKLEEKDDDGNVICYDNSDKPKPLFVAHLITDLRDPENPDDDGSRRVWLKGNGLWALKEFIKANGTGAPKVGDYLWVQVESLKPNPNRMRKPIKQHVARLKKGDDDSLAKALAHARKVEERQASSSARRAEDEFWGGSTTKDGSTGSTGGRTTTLDSMRSSRKANDEPPF